MLTLLKHMLRSFLSDYFSIFKASKKSFEHDRKFKMHVLLGRGYENQKDFMGGMEKWFVQNKSWGLGVGSLKSEKLDSTTQMEKI